MTSRGALGRLGVGDVVALSTVLMSGVGIPLWLAASAGAIGIPTSDDWVYAQGAESLFRTGVIDMPAHTAAAVGQLVLVQPLLWLSGGDPSAFTAFGLFMTAIGLASAYLLAKQFVGTGSAALIGSLLVVFPGLARMSTSFMTDLPCFALITLCLLQGDRWLNGRAGRLTLLTSITAGLVAVSIREFAIAAPVAVLAAGWSRNHASERSWLLLATVMFVIGLSVVLLGAASIGGREASQPQLAGFFMAGAMFATFAAVLLPALVLGLGRRMTTLSAAVVLLGAGLGSLSLIVSWGSPSGNMWMQQGFAGDLLLSGTRADVFPADWWGLSRQLASFAATLLVVSVLTWARPILQPWASLPMATARATRIAQSRDGLLVLFLLAYAAEIILFAPFWVYDRYFFPIVPVAAILLLRGRPQASRFGRSLAVAHGALLWLAVSASVVAANSFAFDAARWREGEAAVSLGYEPRRVDAGYEWIGFHAGPVARSGMPADNTTWTGVRWALRNPCAVVSNSQLEDGELVLIHVNRSAYLRYLFVGPAEPLYLYETTAAGCPAVPVARANRAP